jgi:hypothetical protein
MEGIRQLTPSGVVPLRKRRGSPSPRPKVRNVTPLFRSEGEVLEMYGERRPRERIVPELRDRVPPHRLF